MKTLIAADNHYKHSKSSTVLPPQLKEHGLLLFEDRVASEIEDALKRYTRINTENVHIEVKEYCVYLKGYVESKVQKNDAETVAWICLPDAVNVINELKINSGEEIDEVFEF